MIKLSLPKEYEHLLSNPKVKKWLKEVENKVNAEANRIYLDMLSKGTSIIDVIDSIEDDE